MAEEISPKEFLEKFREEFANLCGEFGVVPDSTVRFRSAKRDFWFTVNIQMISLDEGTNMTKVELREVPVPMKICPTHPSQQLVWSYKERCHVCPACMNDEPLEDGIER